MDKRYFIVLGACMTQFMVIGLLFSFGLFFRVFEEEFGWSRALVSSGTALAMFMMGVLAIPSGRLGDRFGPRIVLTVSGALFGFGYAMISQISEPWHLLLLLGLFVGLGMATHDVITLSTIGRWFERRRGIMTGIVKTGTAAGQVALPPLCAYLIATHDWRTAVVILGVTAGIALLIAARLVRPAPKPSETAATDAEPPGLTFSEARRTAQFWKLCALQFCFFPTLTSIPLHIAVHGEDQGMTTAMAATLLATVGGVSAAGRLIVGAFSDRIGGRNAYMLCFMPLICALVLLTTITDHTAMFAIAALYGFAHGGFFTVVSPTIAESFGTKALGAIFGVIVFCGTVGGAISPILLGRTYDVLGYYDPGFIALACLAGLGLVLAWTLARGRVPLG
ncbi:MAG: MFS transporter [Pseudomonadota bacterium]